MLVSAVSVVTQCFHCKSFTVEFQKGNGSLANTERES